MVNKVKNPINLITNIGRKAHISAQMKAADCLAQAASFNRFQRILMVSSAAVTFLGTLFLPAALYADGLADMTDKFGTQASDIKGDVGKMFAAGGFCCAGYGGWNWIRKGREGDRSQIEGKQIFVPILGGAVLGAIGTVMLKTGQSIGLTDGDHGKVPGAGG
ncbi:hypothetical protein KCM76_22275 [Zooshikella marina]|uniref:DUF6750 family protein n=1 Tax=Zooshikella ganghwensis TaxID=202772 RepID=UPI001BAFF7F8|nr:DUF6750 family protein [Zooshikella ganghwensis]MBU2708736.1 hypothetical protein [Zooshikella ganghwensis]